MIKNKGKKHKNWFNSRVLVGGLYWMGLIPNREKAHQPLLSSQIPQRHLLYEKVLNRDQDAVGKLAWLESYHLCSDAFSSWQLAPQGSVGALVSLYTSRQPSLNI